MSATRKFKNWYEDRCGHSLGVNLGMKAVNELEQDKAELIKHLKSLTNESVKLAAFKNEKLREGICSTDLDEPDWHDYQTIDEAVKCLGRILNK